MSLKSQEGQIISSQLSAGGSAAATNQQPSTPLRMPPIQRKRTGGDNFSLSHQMPPLVEHSKNQGTIMNQRGVNGNANLMIGVSNDNKECLVGAHLLSAQKNPNH